MEAGPWVTLEHRRQSRQPLFVIGSLQSQLSEDVAEQHRRTAARAQQGW